MRLYVSRGVLEPEYVDLVSCGSGEHIARAFARHLSEGENKSLALFGNGAALTHYARRAISAQHNLFPETIRSEKPSRNTFSGGNGVVVEITFKPPEYGGISRDFPEDVKAKVLELALSGKLPGSVIYVGPSSIVIFFLGDGGIWDRELHPLFGMAKNSTVRSPAKIHKMLQLAAQGASSRVAWVLCKEFEPELMPFAIRVPTEARPMFCLPYVSNRIEEGFVPPIIHERTYFASELAREANDKRFTGLNSSPTEIAALVEDVVHEAIHGFGGYLTYRNGDMPIPTPAEIGNGTKIPAAWHRSFGRRSPTSVHLGYVSNDHTRVCLIPAAVVELFERLHDHDWRKAHIPPQMIGWGLRQADKLRLSKDAEHATVKLRVEGARPRVYDLSPSFAARILTQIKPGREAGDPDTTHGAE